MAEERPMQEVVGHRVRVPPQADSDDESRRHGEEENAVQDGEGDRQGVPARVAQDAPPCRGKEGRAHGADFPLKVAVSAGPFQSPATAQTRQVYSSPAFTIVFGVQEARSALAPASTG